MTATALPAAADQSGPPDTRPPSLPPNPPPPKTQLADALAYIDAALIGALGLAATAMPDPTDQVEAAGQAILAFRLRRARAAVADLLQYSGRAGKDGAGVPAARPVRPPAGRPPASGGDFHLPRDVRRPYVNALVMESLARQAD